MTLAGRSIQSEFAATLVDEWVRSGVRHAVVCPGSRSAALALALVTRAEISVHLRLDERSAGFFAIGLALARREPVVLVTTSGTAAAELHPAVIEADLAGVPLVVVTADRPVELHGVGAPQTIDQDHLYGRASRFFLDLPVAEEATRPSWRSYGSRLVAEAVSGAHGPGPVHANLQFREPMVGPAGELPAARADGAPWHVAFPSSVLAPGDLDRLAQRFAGAERAIVVAGGEELSRPEVVRKFGRAHGVPVLSDGRATRREPDGVSVFHADQLVRVPELAEALRPDLVVRVGSPHASKALSLYLEELARTGVPEVVVGEGGFFEDPARTATELYRAEPCAVFDALGTRPGSGRPEQWLTRWLEADGLAAQAIEGYCAIGAPSELTEPKVARTVLRALRHEDLLVVSSSMPVRDLEWFGGATPSAPRVLANRGANGIDGVTSTVLGAATGHGGRTVGLVGDLAFFHDLSGLVFGSEETPPDATLVVVDNGGGGIFSFLSYPAELDEATFRRAFTTPQRPDPRAVVAGLGLPVAEASTVSELEERLEKAGAGKGPSVVVAATDGARNVTVHEELAAAVRNALSRAFP